MARAAWARVAVELPGPDSAEKAKAKAKGKAKPEATIAKKSKAKPAPTADERCDSCVSGENGAEEA